jgi:O-antigen/teichoic acid export membrane protein
VLSALAVVVGPWVIELLYGDRYALPAPAYAAIVASAGLTALLCLTGPAVLAAGDHGRYLLGWAAASASLIGLLLLPLPELERVLFALCASPVVGVLIHAAGLVRRRGGVSG